MLFKAEETGEEVFACLQRLGIIQIQVNGVSLDSTCIKVYPDGMSALKNAAVRRRAASFCGSPAQLSVWFAL